MAQNRDGWGGARGPGLSARASVGGSMAGGGASGASAKQAPPPIEQPFRFQGQQFDEETGLHYNRYRYYDPDVGLYTTQDPIGLFGGININLYTNKPTSHIDPLGLSGNAHQRAVSRGAEQRQAAVDAKTGGIPSSTVKNVSR